MWCLTLMLSYSSSMSQNTLMGSDWECFNCMRRERKKGKRDLDSQCSEKLVFLQHLEKTQLRPLFNFSLCGAAFL